MNLLVLKPSETGGARGGSFEARFDGRRHRHVRDILRLEVGDHLRAGVLGGRVGEARVVAIDDASTVVEVTANDDPPPRLPLVLLLALPRPPTLKKVLHVTAALGVDEIRLLHARRVEKSYWQTPLLESERLEAELLLGLEQGRDTVAPRIAPERRFGRFLADTLDGLMEGRRSLLADVGAERACPGGVGGPALVAVGPEGGWTEDETRAFTERGLEPVGLGPRPLRVEHAVAVLLGRMF